ncbi:MAG TPA: YjgN family protein [Gammaproteobacteria bacterium]|nr:YjgN family protein [Gammaproteobacteria bacterium]
MPTTIPTGDNARKDRLIHHGSGGELFVIFLVNIALKVVTLGIYHFWAKTRIRRYLWTQAGFDGERFEYTGLGGELFFGFLKAMGVLIGLVLLGSILSGVLGMIHPALAALPMVALYITFFVLVGMGIYSARRYTLSRTRWRSIRFAQTGSPLTYARKMIGYTLLTVFTLGLYAPFMKNRLMGYMLSNTYFGTEQVTYDGEGRDLFKPFIIAYLLTLPTLGLVWLWYKAAEWRYIAGHCRLQSLRFSCDVTGGQVFGLMFTNLLLIAFTLGLAFPWVLLRTVRFAFAHLAVAGELDYSAIGQSPESVPGTGEGLVQAFDMGGI